MNFRTGEGGMVQSIVIVETNEIPLRVFQHYADIRKNSIISQLLKQSLVLETLAQDVEKSFLYPSQTWASLNTGASYEMHKIHWYNDPKPVEIPLYWQILANNGISVGVVNTLHSSPAGSYASSSNSYKFVVPDCFAVDTFTKPDYYRNFQALNLGATSENSRVTTLKFPLREALTTLAQYRQIGIKAKTIIDGVVLGSKIATKKISKERLRNLQFSLISDIFWKQLQEQTPQLSVLFTNHVAASMHRYWGGLFKDDWQYQLYDEDWFGRYSTEVINALDLLDMYLKRMVEWSRKTNSILVIVSSMGQEANLDLPENVQHSRQYAFRLENVRKFISVIVKGYYEYQIESAMKPQYSFGFSSQDKAAEFLSEIEKNKNNLNDVSIKTDINGNVVTLTVGLKSNFTHCKFNGQTLHYSDLGFIKFKVEDHHSGRHCPEGSLMIFNSQTAFSKSKSINYLEYAPALLSHFGFSKERYMIEPNFSF